jgi:hypothetical protein
MAKKTAILIRCTPEEADLIRHAAANERRTLSGFVLNAVMNRIKVRTHTPPPLADPKTAPPTTTRRKTEGQEK